MSIPRKDLIIRNILLAIVFLTPLLTPWKQLGYESVKVAFFIGGMLLCLILLTIFPSHIGKKSIRFTTLSQKAAIFIAILGLSSLLGVNPRVSFLGIPPYFQGAIVYLFLFIFYLLVKKIRVSLQSISIAITTSTSIVAAEAIREWLLLHYFRIILPTYSGRVVSTFGQPNFYSGYLVVTLPFFLFLFEKKKKVWSKIVILPMLTLTSIAIVISLSRAAIILMCGFFVWYVLQSLFIKLRSARLPGGDPAKRELPRGAKVAGIVITIVAGFLLFIGVLVIGIKLFDQEVKTSLNRDWIIRNAPEKRLLIWEVAAKQALVRPAFGYGLESFRYVYTDFFNKYPDQNDEAMLSRKKLVVDRAHSYPLDILLSTGIIGLYSWLAFLYALFRRINLPVLLQSLALYLIWSLFQIPTMSHLLLFWLTVGLVGNRKNLA